MSKDPNSDADVVYHRCLGNTSYGHGLYKQVVHDDLKPGTIGYFDANKDWQPILQLTDETSLSEHPKLTVIKKLSEKSAKEGPWAAIVSQGVDGHSVAAKVDAFAPDGSGGGFNFEYTASLEESAILAADGKVTHRQLRFDKSKLPEPDKLRDWMFKNLENILQISGAVEIITKKGIWLVTKTYTAKRAAVAVLRSRNSKTSFGISGHVYGAEASPSASWWTGKKDHSWKELNGDEKSEVVLFVSGIWWIPSRNFFAKQWQKVVDEKQQRFLKGSNKPVPVGIEPSNNSESGNTSDRIIFECYGMGDEANLEDLPQSKRSPFTDPNSEEEMLLDQREDASDDDLEDGDQDSDE